MWGFASVMLTLLFLLMPWTVVHQIRPSVDLVLAPHSMRMPGALKEDALRISISRDGSTYFANVRVSPEDLPGLIREGLRNGAERKAYLKVDARAKYGEVPPVLEKIRAAGIEKVAFLTE